MLLGPHLLGLEKLGNSQAIGNASNNQIPYRGNDRKTGFVCGALISGIYAVIVIWDGAMGNGATYIYVLVGG